MGEGIDGLAVEVGEGDHRGEATLAMEGRDYLGCEE